MALPVFLVVRVFQVRPREEQPSAVLVVFERESFFAIGLVLKQAWWTKHCLQTVPNGAKFNFAVCANEGADKAQHHDQTDQQASEKNNVKCKLHEKVKSTSSKWKVANTQRNEYAWKFDILAEINFSDRLII